MNDQIISADFVMHSASAEPQTGWAVIVRNDRILDVGPTERLRDRFPTAYVVHLAEQALVPAFVNAHHHMYGVLSHGIPLQNAPGGFWSFLREFWWPQVEDALTHEMIAAATDLACLEMVRSGVTTFYDCLEAPNAVPGALAVQAEVVRRWGLRGFLSFEATERQSEENGQLGLSENSDFIESHVRAGGLVQGMMCYHTTFTCSEAFIRKAFALARKLGVRIHAHVSEGTYEPDYCLEHYGKRTIHLYDEWELLGPHMLASQCVQIDKSEIDTLAQQEVSVAHMPLSNCEVGGGFSPVPEMLAAGIKVSLGSDGYINNFFEVMRGAFLLHKARLQDPAVMPASIVWEMATEHGAHALGLSDVGKLLPGYSADLISIDLDLPTSATAANLKDQLLLWRNPEHIRTVMVAGRYLLRDGQVLEVNEDRIRRQSREAAHALWEQ